MGGKNRATRKQRKLQRELARTQQKLAEKDATPLDPVPMPPRGVAVAMARRTVMTSGPLPPPEMLAGYGQVSADFPNRILVMAEKEQANRHASDQAFVQVVTQEQKDNFALAKRGQTIAAGLFGAVLVTAGLLAYWGHPTSATVLATLDVAGVIGLFLNQRAKVEKALAAPSEEKGIEKR